MQMTSTLYQESRKEVKLHLHIIALEEANRLALSPELWQILALEKMVN